MAVAIGGPQNQDQLIVTAFLFYPCVSMCLYFSWLLAVWTGMRMTAYDVILHKPGLLPKSINIPKRAIKSIKMERRAVPDENSVSHMYKVSVCLRDGKEVSLGELPVLTSRTVESLREVSTSVRMQPAGGAVPWLIETKVQFLPILFFWALVAAGAAYYLFLCSRMAAYG